MVAASVCFSDAYDAAGSAVCDNASLPHRGKCIQIPTVSTTCKGSQYLYVARSGSLKLCPGWWEDAGFFRPEVAEKVPDSVEIGNHSRIIFTIIR